MLLTATAVADNYMVNLDDTTVIPAAQGVLANDVGSSLTAVLVAQPSYGTVTLNSDGSFSYTNTSPSDTDAFSYEDFSGSSYSNVVSVSLSVLSGGAMPEAEGQDLTAIHDQTLTVPSPGVLAGASDPNNLHLTLVLQTGVTDGSLTLNSDGSFNYTPVSTFAGTDSFTIEVYDGNSYSSPATEQINVNEMPPWASDDSYSLLNTQTLNIDAANGVLSNDTSDSPLTAALYSGPSNGSLSFNSDGSFSYTPNPGWIGTDTFQYTVTDGVSTSWPATVSLTTDYGVASVVDQTKLPVDTIHVSRQILNDPFGSPITSPLPAGGSGGTTVTAAPADGAPATAHNVALVYDSILAAPDQVIEAEVGFSSDSPIDDTLSAALTFNGVAQPAVYFDMNTMGGGSHVHIAIQVDTSGLASGRYPYSLTINGGKVASPATITGYVNVVNDSASPFGAGWDMPGLYRLFQNNVPGVPAGVLLSTGDGGAWYFTQNDDGSYASPAGAFAFFTLTTVMGGWQLVDKYGTTFNFDSSGDLTSRVERTGETTSYNWTGNELTSIVDQFGRAVNLGYTNGLLSSITDYAGSVWSFADTGGDLTTIIEPDVGDGEGAPVWQYAYSANYLSSVTDPNQSETVYKLDGFHRLSGTDLPGGGSTSDTSEQDFGYGSTSASNPASLTEQSTVTPSDTDPTNDSN